MEVKVNEECVVRNATVNVSEIFGSVVFVSIALFFTAAPVVGFF
jgi:hypothetical protein